MCITAWIGVYLNKMKSVFYILLKVIQVYNMKVSLGIKKLLLAVIGIVNIYTQLYVHHKTVVNTLFLCVLTLK